jgi:hypothetical protein
MEVRQIARSTTVGNNAYTGPMGQITGDTDAKDLRFHDGVTAGGKRIPNLPYLLTLFLQVGAGIGDITGLTAALAAKAGLTSNTFSGDQLISKVAPLLNLKETGGSGNDVLQMLDQNDYVRAAITWARASDSLIIALRDASNAVIGSNLQFDGTQLLIGAAHALLSSEEATAADWRSGTSAKILETAELIASGAYVSLGTGGTITPNFTSFINGYVAGATNVIFANPSAVVANRSGIIRFRQSAGGALTWTWGSAYHFQDEVAIDVATGANKYSYFSYFAESTSRVIIGGITGLN